jgi:hypothetical protein
MKAKINKYYRITHPWASGLVGRDIEIVERNGDTIHGKLPGEKFRRQFDIAEVDIAEESEMVTVLFKHTPKNRHNKRDQWWMFAGNTRYSLSTEQQQIIYAGLDLDYGEESLHELQRRSITEEAFLLLTKRDAAKSYIHNHQQLFGVPDTVAHIQRGAVG